MNYKHNSSGLPFTNSSAIDI